MLITYSNLFNQVIRAIKARKNNMKCYISFYNCYNSSFEKIPGSDDAAKNRRVNTSKFYDYKVNLF